VAAATRAYGAPPGAAVVPAPGTQVLIQLLPRVLASDRAAVVTPTYGEYTPAWKAAGAPVHEVSDAASGLAALAGARRPALVLCNPNNPDGRTLPPAQLRDLADQLAAAGGALVVDEAFADVAPEVSVAARADRTGLVVLRSFGKFFGLAGLRLGFALCPSELGRALAQALGPWAVPGPALEIGRVALADDAWQTAMRRRLAQDARRLEELLAGAGLESAGGTALFRLARSPEAAAWHDRLARAGVWVRAFPRQPDRVRVGLPGDAAGWRRLAAALGADTPPARA
jgi:cobalamin biosynthetic protein CobC